MIANKRGQYINELLELEIVKKNNIPYATYVSDLLNMQQAMSKMINEDSASEMRTYELIAYLEAKAREKGVSQDHRIRRTIKGLYDLSKEISISIAGKAAEDRVASSMEYCQRELRQDVSIYRNIYVSDENCETEIDEVITTNTGIIILEIKGIKNDITLTDQGRLMINNEECHHNVNMKEKMRIKRELIKKQLLTSLKERGMDMELPIDSYIVFCSPKGVHPKITDELKTEKFCSKGKIPYVVQNYQTGIRYTDEEMKVLEEIIQSMSICQKSFGPRLNFTQICTDYIDTLNLICPEKDTDNDNVKSRNRGIKHVYTYGHVKRPMVMWPIIGFAISAGIMVGVTAWPNK